MKKQTLVATLGTLALLANVLLPGLAFGQTQTGTADIGCSVTAATYNLTPNAAVTFTSDGVGGTLYSQLAAQEAFGHGPSALGNTAGTDFISIVDTRDPSETGCNDGTDLELTVIDGTDADGIFFDATPAGAGGDSIPLTGLYYVTSGATCPAGWTELNTTSGICFNSTALCGAGDGSPATTCDNTTGVTLADYATGTAFDTMATFTADADSTLGSAANTATARDILVFNDGTELYGEAGVGVAYATAIPANQATGTYVVELQYSVTGN